MVRILIRVEPNRRGFGPKRKICTDCCLRLSKVRRRPSRFSSFRFGLEAGVTKNNRKAPPDNDLCSQGHFRREPCDNDRIHSPPRTSMPTPPCGSKSISASPGTAANAPPIPCGPSSSTPPVASSPWPLPVPPYVTPPPTPPPTMLCSLLSRRCCGARRRLDRRQDDLPHALGRRRQPSAIDLRAALPRQTSARWPRDLSRSSQERTSHFHAYATAYVIRKGRRFTVALIGRPPSTPGRGIAMLLRQRVGRRPPALCAAGLRFLQRGRDSLPAKRPLRLVDAAGVTRPQGRPCQGSFG